MSFEIYPLTPDRWEDFAALFRTDRITRQCWCMWWRIRGSEFAKRKTAENRADFERRVAASALSADDLTSTSSSAAITAQQAEPAGSADNAPSPPGLLAYMDGRAVGWVSLAPRVEFVRLRFSPTVYKALDDDPRVWSVLCFFVHKDARGQGIGDALLSAATQFAHERGASAVEAFPVDPQDRTKHPDKDGRLSAGSAYPGLLSMFERAGFQEITRRQGRPLVRLDFP